MKRTILKIFLGCSVFIMMCSYVNSSADITRWYTADLVSQGKPLYVKYCADCHGEGGQGGPNWRKPLPNGSYPAQPLNGSGHSWHHPLSQLDKTISLGGTHPGAAMPGFGNILDRQQRLAVIAAFQSFWSDGIYQNWLHRGGLSR